MQPAAPVDREIQGTLVQVEVRQGGWHRFHIMEAGNQFPTKADTKRPEIIQQGMSLMGQQIAGQIREQDSTTINPNSGKFYVNRHINQIAPIGSMPSQPAPQQQALQQAWVQQQQAQTPPQPPQPVSVAPVASQTPSVQPGIMGFEKDLNIMRQCASKVAAEMLELLPPEQQTMQGLVALSEAWVAYYTYGPYRFGVQPFSSEQGQPALSRFTGYDENLDGNPGDESDRVYASTGVCPDCGFSGGTHAEGCPRGVPQEAS